MFILNLFDSFFKINLHADGALTKLAQKLVNFVQKKIFKVIFFQKKSSKLILVSKLFEFEYGNHAVSPFRNFNMKILNIQSEDLIIKISGI